MTSQLLPPLARYALKLIPLGDRRTDIESDLAELFAARTAARGTPYAWRRLAVDIASIALPLPAASPIGSDLRSALRLFRRHAAPISITVAGLGLAIAVCTAVFSILNAVVLRPYGVDDPQSLVRLHRLHRLSNSTSWPYSSFSELHARSTTPVEASATDDVRLTMSATATEQKPDSILFVSGGYLPLLGGRAVIGRSLAPADDDPAAPAVVVINYAFWKSRLNADRTIVGRTMWLSGTPVTVAGVLEPRFDGPTDAPAALLATFGAYGQIYRSRPLTRNTTLAVSVIARVPPSMSRAAAQAQLSAVAAGLAPVPLGEHDADARPITGVRLEGAGSRIAGDDALNLWMLVAVVAVIGGLVLMVACANAANLLLAGALTRGREIGVRMAMGASRAQIAQLLMTESVLIALAAGAVGLLLSVWLVPSLAAAIDLPPTYDVRPDITTFLISAALAIATGFGAGIAPARFGARGDLLSALKAQNSRGGSRPKAARLRVLFVAAQAAASMLLMVTAALFTRGALHLSHVDLGFDADRLMTVTVALPEERASDGRVEAFWRGAIERASALPSVERVSLALHPPFSGSVSITEMDRGGTFRMYENGTDANYFETAGLRIVRGRAYTAEEVATNAPVALVSESIAREFFPGRDAIGGSMTDIFARAPRGVSIIGIVADAITTRIRDGRDGMLYRPIAPSLFSSPRLVVRSPQPSAAAHDLAAVLRSVDPQARVTIDIVKDNVDRRFDEPRILASLAAAVAALAMALAALGIHGVTAFAVSQRTQEVSVRMAIGASRADVVRLFIRQGVMPVAAGFVVGLAAAMVAGRVLSEALSGISPYDPIAIGCAVALLTVTALAAVVLPARRAANADPASVLRSH